ncbi:MAG: hypothetical protein HC908_10215 [Calothrix sp. SM1_7_51]|nr:hypothetical protein [Calothrix sp. SM1_7_51]
MYKSSVGEENIENSKKELLRQRLQEKKGAFVLNSSQNELNSCQTNSLQKHISIEQRLANIRACLNSENMQAESTAIPNQQSQYTTLGQCARWNQIWGDWDKGDSDWGDWEQWGDFRDAWGNAYI